MDIDKFQETLDETFGSVKSYFNLKTELFKVILFERLSKFLTKALTLIIYVFLFFFLVLFLSLAFVQYYRETGGNLIHGYIIVASFYLIIGVIIRLFSKKIFLNPMVKEFSETAFEEDEDFLNSGNNEDKKNGKN
jgi:hypothetical protein